MSTESGKELVPTFFDRIQRNQYNSFFEYIRLIYWIFDIETKIMKTNKKICDVKNNTFTKPTTNIQNNRRKQWLHSMKDIVTLKFFI